MRKIDQPSQGDLVGLSVEDAREITRLLKLMLDRLGESDNGLAARARMIFAQRRRRARYFNSAMFDEPAWDMLLALYITDVAGGRLTVGQLISWVGVPHSTAIRWIDYLEKERFVVREAGDEDRRVVRLNLTDKARNAMNSYLGEVDLAFSGID